MIEFLFEIPMDLQFYLLFMSALLPLSLLVVHQYLDTTYTARSFAATKSTYDVYITKSLLHHTVLRVNTVIIFIATCVKLKDSPNDDDDDHPLLLTP